jgi:hypothetical protein
MSSHASIRYLLAALAVAACFLVPGCKGKSAGKMTDDEVKQAQAGPPKEMPAEARAAMERMKSAPPPALPKGTGK